MSEVVGFRRLPPAASLKQAVRGPYPLIHAGFPPASPGGLIEAMLDVRSVQHLSRSFRRLPPAASLKPSAAGMMRSAVRLGFRRLPPAASLKHLLWVQDDAGGALVSAGFPRRPH